jgi:hypothetical protein
MEFLAGVYDLYAFAAISRRWLFWLLAASIPLGLIVIALNLVDWLRA